MNKYIFLLLVIVAIVSNAHSEEFFLQGNQCFAKGDFVGAVELYKKIEEPSALVFMNIGIAYFNMEKYLESRIFFLRACNIGSMKIRKKINSYQKNIDNRLGLLQEKTKIDLVKEWLQGIPLSIIQLWILICFGLLFYCLLKKKNWKLHFFLYAFLVVSSAFWWHHFKQSEKKRAVVVKETDVYSGPEYSFFKKNLVQLGIVVNILDQQKDMIEIMVNKQRGWVACDSLALV